MYRIALLNNGTPPAVITVALWDGASAWNPVGLTITGQLVASTEDVTAYPQVCAGWTYSGGSWIAPAPAAPAPDPDGFVRAIVASSVAAAVMAAATTSLYALTVAIATGNTSQITGMWQSWISLYAISTADQATVAALAEDYGIPGIS